MSSMPFQPGDATTAPASPDAGLPPEADTAAWRSVAPPPPWRMSAALLEAARAVNRYHSARIGVPTPEKPPNLG